MKENLLDKKKCYVVGVSGGCDSMYLLDTLREKGYRVLVAHVNYNYRHDSHVDFRLVKDYCCRYQIPFYYCEFHENDYTGGNFQDQARMMRYTFYQDIYKMYHCDGLILGHQYDDHLENIYMQLEHHSTVFYLGIKEVNHVEGMTIIRPLLDYTKQDIVDLCCQKHIPYHDDYTNFETDFERDRVRNTVLNHYTKAQKEELFLRASKHNQRMEALEQEVMPYYKEYTQAQTITYSSIPEHLMDIFLYLILKDKMMTQLISYSLICEIKKQLKSSKPNIAMNLPVNYVFIKEYDNIGIIENQISNDYSYRFHELKEFHCSNFTLTDHGHEHQGVPLTSDDFPIEIRNIRPGDRIQTLAGTKKVSRLFIDAKIPMYKRKRWPLLVNRKGTIVLVPNIAKNIDYLTTNSNVFVLE